MFERFQEKTEVKTVVSEPVSGPTSNKNILHKAAIRFMNKDEGSTSLLPWDR